MIYAVPVGAQFANVGYTGTTQIIDPGSNVNGVVIRTLELQCVGDSGGSGSIYVGSASPASEDDPTTRALITGYVGLDAVLLPYPVVLPAGWGAWAAVSSGSQLNTEITWDTMPWTQSRCGDE
jgi:hypothetical protein